MSEVPALTSLLAFPLASHKLISRESIPWGAPRARATGEVQHPSDVHTSGSRRRLMLPQRASTRCLPKASGGPRQHRPRCKVGLAGALCAAACGVSRVPAAASSATRRRPKGHVVHIGRGRLLRQPRREQSAGEERRSELGAAIITSISASLSAAGAAMARLRASKARVRARAAPLRLRLHFASPKAILIAAPIAIPRIALLRQHRVAGGIEATRLLALLGERTD